MSDDLMRLFTWSWTKFIVGIYAEKIHNLHSIKVWCVSIHLGFVTIIICPKWNYKEWKCWACGGTQYEEYHLYSCSQGPRIKVPDARGLQP